MSKFFTKSIEEITERLIDYRGKTPPKTDRGIKLITAKVVKGGIIQDGNHEYIAEEIYDKWMTRGLPKQWDVLITTEAPLGEVAQLKTPEKVALAQRIILLRGKPNVVDQRYYFYALQSSFVQAGLQARATGTTVLGIKQSELRKVEIPLYPLQTQRKISAVLSAYDDLIENNTRRIAILEEMAQTLYREWFVHFRFPGHEDVALVDVGGVNGGNGRVPEGWKVVPLNNLVQKIHNAEASGEHLFDLAYVPIDQFPQKSLALTTSKLGTDAKSSLIRFNKDDILFGAMRPYLHKVVLAPFEGITRSTCFVLRPKKKIYYSYIALTMFSEQTVAYADQHSKGTTIPYAAWDNALADMMLVKPPDELLTKFETIVHPMLQFIQQNFFRQANLRQTRDLLLPRLISGELQVPGTSEVPGTLGGEVPGTYRQHP